MSGTKKSCSTSSLVMTKRTGLFTLHVDVIDRARAVGIFKLPDPFLGRNLNLHGLAGSHGVLHPAVQTPEKDTDAQEQRHHGPHDFERRVMGVVRRHPAGLITIAPRRNRSPARRSPGTGPRSTRTGTCTRVSTSAANAEPCGRQHQQRSHSIISIPSLLCQSFFDRAARLRSAGYIRHRKKPISKTVNTPPARMKFDANST